MAERMAFAPYRLRGDYGAGVQTNGTNRSLITGDARESEALRSTKYEVLVLYLTGF
jgi:hypothetical protein